MGVTTKEKQIHHGYKLKYWKDAGLKMQSWVRFEYLEMEPGDFRDKLGMLHKNDIEGLQEWILDVAYGHKRYGLN